VFPAELIKANAPVVEVFGSVVPAKLVDANVPVEEVARSSTCSGP
jgi:hypothetical protein